MVIKKGTKLPPREPKIGTSYYRDTGCDLYPTCFGKGKYPECPFKKKCIEDYSRSEASAIRRWFLKEIGKQKEE